MDKKSLAWSGGTEQVAVDLLLEGGRMIVSPTKVGYIIMTTDIDGLTRKFSSKKRSLNKPGVVLCGSMEQLRKLAVLNAEIDAFYHSPGITTFCWAAFCRGKKTPRSTFPVMVRSP